MSRAGTLREAAISFAVAALSLALLIYVGWGEAKRTYPAFVVEKMAAQGELVQSALATYLRAGLPLRQFPGFAPIAEPILESDPGLAAIAVWDGNGKAFGIGDAAAPRLDGPPVEGRFAVHGDAAWLQVVLPLANRFETVGELVVTTPAPALEAATTRPLQLWIAVAVGLVVAQTLVVALAGGRLAASRLPWLGLLQALVFLAMAGVVVATLISLYADGAQQRARALAASLAQRLEPVETYGLRLEEFSGLEATLAEYRRMNPDVAAVGVLRDGKVVVHSDPGRAGAPWSTEDSTYEFVEPVGPEATAEIRVAVALPAEIVWRAVARSAKNFASLFIASGLMAGFFLQLARALDRRGSDEAGAADAVALALIRPVFFVAVFVENLGAGFLPQILRRSAEAWGSGPSAASLAFTAYFVCFLAVLLPASQVADRRGPKVPIVAGALLAAAALLLQALGTSFPLFVAARALAGLGQGALFIGVQAAILAYAPAAMRTRAAAIIVFGFNGGMIAGAAIGSLLVSEIGASGVFAAGAAVALLLTLYVAVAVAGGMPGAAVVRRQSFGRLLADIPRAFASLGFLRAFLLIGAPSKAVLTGIVGFALPLLLSGMGWPPEDIGQIIMLYACCVLLSSGPMSRLVDHTGHSGAVLAAGGLVSGLGLLVAGSVGTAGLPDWLADPAGQTALVLAGVALLGLAHGCINAPVITYVADSTAARRLGSNGATSLYRVVERIGHVLGPVLAGQLLALAASGPAALLWAGAAILACGLLFALPELLMRRRTA
ncbi:MAG: MFS transporter [Geminicoccaceae bacterium]